MSQYRILEIPQLDGGDKYEKIFNAFYKAFLKPLPWWRILYCSKKSNIKWYDKRVEKYLSIVN